jgi:hypothetical protein
VPSASRGKAARGEFAQTPPRRYQSQQVIWVPPAAEGIPTRLDAEQLTLSQPPIAAEEPTRGQPYHPSPGRADPSPNEPRGLAPAHHRRRGCQQAGWKPGGVCHL